MRGHEFHRTVVEPRSGAAPAWALDGHAPEGWVSGGVHASYLHLHWAGVPGVADAIMREAYSHELSSAGFWPGGGGIDYPAFYSYAYPEPAGFADARVAPSEAFYSKDVREFILPYDAVRTAGDPDALLLTFLQSTYAAAADLGGWDRNSLEAAGSGGSVRAPIAADGTSPCPA